MKRISDEKIKEIVQEAIDEFRNYSSNYGGSLTASRNRGKFLGNTPRIGNVQNSLSEKGALITNIINQITRQGSKIVNSKVGSIIVTSLVNYAKSNKIRINASNIENFIKKFPSTQGKQVINMLTNPNGHSMFSGSKVNLIITAINDYIANNKVSRYTTNNENELIENTLQLLQSRGNKMIGIERNKLLIKALNEYAKNHNLSNNSNEVKNSYWDNFKDKFTRMISEDEE